MSLVLFLDFFIPFDQFSSQCYKTPITVSSKNTHLPDFETCVFRGYLRNHLSYKKVIYVHLFAALSEELSDEKRNVEIW